MPCRRDRWLAWLLDSAHLRELDRSDVTPTSMKQRSHQPARLPRWSRCGTGFAGDCSDLFLGRLSGSGSRRSAAGRQPASGSISKRIPAMLSPRFQSCSLVMMLLPCSFPQHVFASGWSWKLSRMPEGQSNAQLNRWSPDESLDALGHKIVVDSRSGIDSCRRGYETCLSGAAMLPN